MEEIISLKWLSMFQILNLKIIPGKYLKMCNLSTNSEFYVFFHT